MEKAKSKGADGYRTGKGNFNETKSNDGTGGVSIFAKMQYGYKENDGRNSSDDYIVTRNKRKMTRDKNKR